VTGSQAGAGLRYGQRKAMLSSGTPGLPALRPPGLTPAVSREDFFAEVQHCANAARLPLGGSWQAHTSSAPHSPKVITDAAASRRAAGHRGILIHEKQRRCDCRTPQKEQQPCCY